MKTETVTLDSGTYEVRELTMREMLPLLEDNDGLSGTAMAAKMAEVAVSQNGAALGESVLDLGFSDFQKIMEALNRANNFAMDEGDEGND